MANGDHWDEFFYPTLILTIDSYSHTVCIHSTTALTLLAPLLYSSHSVTIYCYNTASLVYLGMCVLAEVKMLNFICLPLFYFIKTLQKNILYILLTFCRLYPNIIGYDMCHNDYLLLYLQTVRYHSKTFDWAGCYFS